MQCLCFILIVMMQSLFVHALSFEQEILEIFEQESCVNQAKHHLIQKGTYNIQKTIAKERQTNLNLNVEWKDYPSQTDGVMSLSPSQSFTTSLSLMKKTDKGLDFEVKNDFYRIELPLWDSTYYGTQLEFGLKAHLIKNRGGRLSQLKQVVKQIKQKQNELNQQANLEKKEMELLLLYWDMIGNKTSLAMMRKRLLRRYYLMKKKLIQYQKGVVLINQLVIDITVVQTLLSEIQRLKIVKRHLEKRMSTFLCTDEWPREYFFILKEEKLNINKHKQIEKYILTEKKENYSLSLIKEEKNLSNSRISLLNEQKKADLRFFFRIGTGQKANSLGAATSSITDLSETYFSSGVNMSLPIGERDKHFEIKKEKEYRKYWDEIEKQEEKSYDYLTVSSYEKILFLKNQVRILNKLCQVAKKSLSEVLHHQKTAKIDLGEHHLYWMEVHKKWEELLLKYIEYRKEIIIFLFHKGLLRQTIMKGRL